MAEYVMEAIFLKFGELGPLGLIAAVLIYDVFYLQRKLIQIIENNTKAMQDLKSFCAHRKDHET